MKRDYAISRNHGSIGFYGLAEEEILIVEGAGKRSELTRGCKEGCKGPGTLSGPGGGDFDD